MQIPREVWRSIGGNKSYVAAVEAGHLVRGWGASLTASAGGNFHRVDLRCDYCGAHLVLNRNRTQDEEIDWNSKCESQTALSSNCDARHEAIREYYRRLDRQLSQNGFFVR